MVIPEILIQNTMDSTLEFIKEDLKSNPVESTWLYKIFAQNRIKSYDYFTQCKEILLKDKKEDKVFQFFQSFSADRTQYPAVYINESSADETDQTLGAGILGDYENIEFESEAFDQYQNRLERRFRSNYEFLIVGETKNQTVVLKNLIQAMLVTMTNFFGSCGIHNIKIGSKAVMINQKIPDGRYFKSVTLKFDTEIVVPELEIVKIYKDALLSGKMIIQ